MLKPRCLLPTHRKTNHANLKRTYIPHKYLLTSPAGRHLCRDEYAFGDFNQAKARAVAEIPETLRPAIFGNTIQLFELCAAWGAGTAPARENEAVVSDIPTLIMVGEYDPSTPHVWGKLTAQTLSSGYYFEFRASGDSLLSGVECAIRASDEFITNPNAEPDRGCINAMEAPFFELP